MDKADFVRSAARTHLGLAVADDRLALANDVLRGRQAQLPPRRVELIQERCPLLGLRFADAESHPEIQIADILAGTVRHLTENPVPELQALLPPHIPA